MLVEIEKPVLAGTRCYLSGPIENDVTHKHNWRTEPKKVLTERFNIDLFDPFEDPKQDWVPEIEKARTNCDYDRIAELASGFVRKDLCMVDRSDFIIAYLPKGVPTTGTHHEVITSSNNKKPTLLVCPEGKQHLPVWYYGFIPHEVMFGSWGELYDYLEEVEQGVHVSNNRWHYVYGLI